MNPLIKFFQYGSAPPPVPPPGPTKSVALNGGPIEPHDSAGSNMFINLFNATFFNWNNVGFDPVTWCPSLTGGTIACNLGDTWSGETFSKIKSGSYVMKWQGAALTATVSGAGVTQLSQVGNRVNFTVAQIDASPLTLHVSFTGTGATSNLVACHIDHETLWDQGEIWNPDYVAFCGTRVAFYRGMKALGVENSKVTTDTTYLLNENHLFWGVNTDENGNRYSTGLPYSALAKLGVKLNCDIMAECPIGASDAVMAVLATQLASVPAFTGNFYMEAGNENWNFSYQGPVTGSFDSTANWLQNTYAPAHGLPNRGAAEAHIALRWARALRDAGIPRSRIKICLGGQSAQFWGAPGGGSLTDLSMQYIDTANIMGSGGNKHFYELCDVPLISSYATPNATGVSSDDDLYFGNIQKLDWANMSDAQVDFYYDNGISLSAGWIANAHAYYQALRPALAQALTSYEAGQQFIGSFQNGGAFDFYIDPVRNTGVYITIPANPTNGNACYFEITSPVTGYVARTTVYIRAVDATQCRFYTTQALATANYATDADAKLTSMNLNVTPVAGPFYFANLTRCVDAGTRIITYLDTAAGKAMYQRAYAAWIGAGKMQQWCQLYDSGGYINALAGLNTAWGLKSSIYSPDTLRSTWFLAQ